MLAPLIIGTLLLSVLLCLTYLRLARRWQIVDLPNARSAHSNPTPRGGGVAIILAWACAMLVGYFWYGADLAPIVPLVGATAIMALTGFWDDIKGLSATTRLIIYALVCAAVLSQILSQRAPVSLWLLPLAFVYLLWLCNLYNFMDGIDGIAGVETLFVGAAAAGLGSLYGAPVWQLLAALALAAAACGFLFFNWPRASLFMGDSGSVSLGFVIGVLSLSGTTEPALPIACWLILLGAFITDSSYTLLWRWRSGEVVTQAHNQHLYQRLSRHWNSHEKVLWALMLLNLAWLLPLAACAAIWPAAGAQVTVIAYLPLVILMWKSDKIT